jgi:hypothetical protein
MWSGPRNISTALMRSWGNRPDTWVCDEPLYAHYLLSTGIRHPGREETLRAHESDWRRVVAGLVGPVPGERAIYYQKHMAHHLLGHIERGWLKLLAHCFLIRRPREMLASLIKRYPEACVTDTGLPQQVELFRQIRRWSNRVPPVVDSRDLLCDPRGMLRALCAAVGVDFDTRMLSWPPGPRETDGAWAPYWYGAVNATTTFVPYRAKDCAVPAGYEAMLSECETYYEELSVHRLSP